MKSIKITLKYYSLKMLLTIDLNNLISVLASVFREPIQLDLLEMSEDEKRQCSSLEKGVLTVTERIWVLEVHPDGICRRNDLEQRVVDTGQK